MKNISMLVFSFTLLAGAAWGQCTTPPEGHIESAGDNPDGKAIPYNTLTISSITGTAHNRGADQADADSRGVVYSIYIAWDRTRASGIDANDEPPNANSTLSAQINNSVTTLPVTSTKFFRNEGIVRLDSLHVGGTELVAYTGKTATTLTGCTRGYNETSAAAYPISGSGTEVTNVAGFELVTTIVCDGAPHNAIGWDETSVGADDGTEGNLLQDGTTITLIAHRSYYWKLRVWNGSGSTNTEVAESDVFYSYSSNCYVDENGDVGQGLEDDEVWYCTTTKRPAVAKIDSWELSTAFYLDKMYVVPLTHETKPEWPGSSLEQAQTESLSFGGVYYE